MIEVTLRVVCSLAVVLLLMWGLARLVRKPLGGRGGPLGVLARQALTRNASVAVIRIDGRALVLGVTESQVTLLAETDLAAFEPGGVDEVAGRARHAAPDQREPGSTHRPELSGGPLAGSVLSPATWAPATWAPATWAYAVEFLRDRTSRQR
jgi:flagellar protein FliO/FliZ